MNKAKIVLFLAFLLAIPRFLQTEYTLTTEIIEVQQPNDEYADGYVVCEADNGNIYSFYGAENWFVGDIAEITLNDNGTPQITDDKVVKAIYRGYIK